MELPISNIGLIKPAALESKELFTKVKSFLKEAFGKDLTVSQHKALGYDINFETQTKRRGCRSCAGRSGVRRRARGAIAHRRE